MKHWAEQYIGRPWENGAQGPLTFDCWALVRHVQRVHFDRELPIIDVDALALRDVVKAFSGHAEIGRWSRVPVAKDGDCVLFGRVQKHAATHVGVWAAGGALHCLQGAGVIFQGLPELRRAWGRIEFYRFAA